MEIEINNQLTGNRFYMNIPDRNKEILTLINDIWMQNSDMNFFQIIYILQSKYCNKYGNLGKVTTIEEDGIERTGFNLFDTEDDELIELLNEIVLTQY